MFSGFVQLFHYITSHRSRVYLIPQNQKRLFLLFGFDSTISTSSQYTSLHSRCLSYYPFDVFQEEKEFQLVEYFKPKDSSTFLHAALFLAFILLFITLILFLFHLLSSFTIPPPPFHRLNQVKPSSFCGGCHFYLFIQSPTIIPM